VTDAPSAPGSPRLGATERYGPDAVRGNGRLVPSGRTRWSAASRTIGVTSVPVAPAHPQRSKRYARGVTPDPRARRGVPAGSRRLIVVLAALLVAACGPAATFDPTGACVADGRAAGAYPELEALVPRDLGGAPPTSVDSGRSCSERALGTLADHGLDELHFAGATWDEGNGAGTSIAVLANAGENSAAPLPVAWVEEFYLAGALASGKTSNVKASRPTIGGTPVWRLDALNDLSQQAVVAWPLGDLVQVVLVATHVDPGASLAEHERRVELAVRIATEVVLPSPD